MTGLTEYSSVPVGEFFDTAPLEDLTESTTEPLDSLNDQTPDIPQNDQETDIDSPIAIVPKSTGKKRGRPPRSSSTASHFQKKEKIVKEVFAAQKKGDPDDILAEDIEDIFDEVGETRIDKDGVLSGDRKYKARTWILPRNPTKHYMLGMDVSKALGFRDSYIFFLRNPTIHRINASDFDRQFLMDNGIPPNNLRSKNVPIVSARSIFRYFGHKIIRRGKAVRDDYFVKGKVEGSESSDEDEYYDATLGTGSFTGEDRELSERKKPQPSTLWKMDIAGAMGTKHAVGFGGGSGNIVVDESENAGGNIRDVWLMRNAQSAAEFNAKLTKNRKKSFYDIHTNVVQKPVNTYPRSVSVHMEVGNDNWVPVWDGGKVGMQYPLAISPGDYQECWSLYPHRFNAQFAPIAPPQQTPTPMDGVVPTNNIIDQPMERKIANFPNIDGVPICDAILAGKEGRVCGRLVSAPFEKCGYHQPKKAAPTPITPTPKPAPPPTCCICNSLTAPESTPPTLIPPTLTLTCTKCNLKHHPKCIDLLDPVIIEKTTTYTWHCSNCKICSICDTAGDDAKLLFCDTCDRGYHMYCLNPVMDNLPDGSWICTECAICTSCGKTPLTTTTPQKRGIAKPQITPKITNPPVTFTDWKHAITTPTQNQPNQPALEMPSYICTYCTDCFRNFESDRYCPLCLHCYREDEDLPMVCCDNCDRWIHVGCDPDLTDEAYAQLSEEQESKYTCVLCDYSRTMQMVDRCGREQRRLFKVVEYKGKRLVAPPCVFRDQHP